MKTLALILSLLAVTSYAAFPPTFEQITVATTGIGISSSVIKPDGLTPRSYCLLTLETAEIRWRSDGLSPTTTVGHVFSLGGTLQLYNQADMQSIRFIRTGGTSGTLTVTCW